LKIAIRSATREAVARGSASVGVRTSEGVEVEQYDDAALV